MKDHEEGNTSRDYTLTFELHHLYAKGTRRCAFVANIAEIENYKTEKRRKMKKDIEENAKIVKR